MSFLWLLIISHILWDWLAAIWRGLAARQKPVSTFSLARDPFISILIPAWNEHAVIGPALMALQASDYSNWEAVVIAGGSDGTEEVARQLCKDWAHFTVIHQLPHGKNAALNLGLAQTQGKIVVLLDADTDVEHDWLANIVAPIASGADAVTGNYSPKVLTWVSALLEIEKMAAYFVRGVVTLNGCAGIALTRQLLERIGGFPESVTVGVDFDLDRRVKNLGIRPVFASMAHAKTEKAYTLAEYWRTEVRWRRAHLQNIFRHREWVGLLFYINAVLFYLAPFAVFSPWWEFWPLLWSWILFRRLSLSIETLAFDRAWSKYGWVPVLLLPVDFLIGLVAFATLGRKVVLFKGFRPVER
jgi:cellulose synthase/poly-beta-1,6-N-acetylglucosamine synthase-like glycosyltransferase